MIEDRVIAINAIQPNQNQMRCEACDGDGFLDYDYGVGGSEKLRREQCDECEGEGVVPIHACANGCDPADDENIYLIDGDKTCGNCADFLDESKKETAPLLVYTGPLAVLEKEGMV